MHIQSLSFVESTWLYAKISELSNRNYSPDTVCQMFSENCNDVSFGDNDKSLITLARFLKMVLEIPEFRDDEDISIPFKLYVATLGENIYVDLES